MSTKTPFKLLIMCSVSLVALGNGETAFANPIGGEVVGGEAAIQSNGKKLSVYQNSDKTVIDWRGFDIKADEHTEFHQPSDHAIALNRVNALNPSQINGKLSANGNLIIVNPNGVVFGENSKVDVNSLVATTADIDNQRFMSGDLTFNKPGKADATITNHGTLTAKDAGLVGLVAPNVENRGTINARLGKVQLASGDTMAVDFYGDGLYEIKISDDVKSQLVSNTGTLNAEGGAIQMTAAAGRNIVDSLISVQGELNAPSTTQRGGKIIIGEAFALSTPIARKSPLKTTVNAKLNTSVSPLALTNISPRPKPLIGGKITVTGDTIEIQSDSQITANGHDGGGNILIGGDYMGKGKTPNANRTTVALGAVIKANALKTGDGGKVIIWADDTTDFHGNIEAKGGAQGGDGGFVETSGKRLLTSNGNVDASAAMGKGGQWLLDPTNITISDSGSEDVSAGGSNTTGSVDADTIETALNAGTSVTITTNIGGADDGDITISSANINKTSGGDATLSLIADRDINNAGTSNITTSSGDNTLYLSAGRTIGFNSGITISATSGTLDVIMNADNDGVNGGNAGFSSSISTNGGEVIISGGNSGFAALSNDDLNFLRNTGFASGYDGTYKVGVQYGNIDSGAGNITIRGKGSDDPAVSRAYGVYSLNTQITTTSGAVTLVGIGGDADQRDSGVYLQSTGATSYGITTDAGNIDITGTAGDSTSGKGSGGQFYGSTLSTNSGAISLTGNGGNGGGSSGGITLSNGTYINSMGTGAVGNISIIGNGGNVTGRNTGIYMTDAHINTKDADVILTGDGKGDSVQFYGIYGSGASTITSDGVGADAGKISLNGTVSAAGSSRNDGVYLNSIDITSTDGDISVIGTGGDGTSTNRGIYGEDVTIESIGTGDDAANITLNGTGGNGSSAGNHGVLLSDTNARITTADGDISITGQARGTSSLNYGVLFSAGAITSSAGTDGNAGKITLNGTGSHTGTSDNYGVYIASSNASITSDEGDISITGNGGNGSAEENIGIFVESGAQITSTGTDADAATITLNGTGGNGTDSNLGVWIENTGTKISSQKGAVDITGTGGAGTGGFNYGMTIRTNAMITAKDGSITLTGTGNAATPQGTLIGTQLFSNSVVSSTGTGANAATITLNGTGGDGTATNHGFDIRSASITSVDGDISITGQGGVAATGGSNYGVYLQDATIASTNEANITFTGMGGANTSNGIRADTTASTIGEVGGNNMLGDITLISDAISFPTAAAFKTDGNITLKPRTANRNINIGGGTGALDISATDIAMFDAGQKLIIGDSALGSGTIDISALDLSASTQDIEVYGGDFTLTGGAGALDLGAGDFLFGDPTGDLSITGTIRKTAGAVSDLILRTANSIVADTFVADASTAPNGLNVVLNSDSDGNSDGAIQLTSNTITSNGGEVILSGGNSGETVGSAADLAYLRSTGVAHGNATYKYGINLVNSPDTRIIADEGNITLRGHGTNSGGDNNYGVRFYVSRASTTTGDINIYGEGGDGANYNRGVQIQGVGNTIFTDTGTINITGQGGQGTGLGNTGIQFASLSNVRSTGVAGAGDIILNGRGGAGTANNHGIELTSGAVASISGDITLTGTVTGAVTSNSNYGIYQRGGFDIISSGTGADAANITINGTGGDGLVGNTGYRLTGSGTTVSTVDGDISITGAGNGSSTENQGLRVDTSALIESTGTGAEAGKITINGTGGDSSSNAFGIYLIDAKITSADGDIAITGEGNGSGHFAAGIYNARSVISSTGIGVDAAKITLNGTGGNAGGVQNFGIRIAGDAAQITTVDGDITLNGTGGNGSGSNNHGIYVFDGADITSTGTGATAGTITLNGTGGDGTSNNYGVNIDGSATSIASVDGDIQITAQGGAGSSTDNWGMNFNAADIISTGTGTNAATITVDATGGNGGASTIGFYTIGATSSITSVDGDITINGTGGTATSNSHYGVVINNTDITSSGTTADAANIAITGIAGANGGSNNRGVQIRYADSQIQTNQGDITIIGTGKGNSSENHGIYVFDGADITSTGTGANAGTITLDGTGGDGTDSNHGVSLIGDGIAITSTDGAISVTGQGGNGTGSDNKGISIAGDVDITSTGTGANAATITLNGTGGTGTTRLNGVDFDNDSRALISSIDGNIAITGVAGDGSSTSNIGVRLRKPTIRSTGTDKATAATITINGTAGEGTNTNVGIAQSFSHISTIAGDVSLIGQGGAGANVNNRGIAIDGNSSIISSGTDADAGNITLTGTGGAGSDGNDGITINGSTAKITVVDGDLLITGTGGTGSADHYGVSLEDGITLASTGTGIGAGTITLDGTSGDGNIRNYGVFITGANALITSADGAIDITGAGNGSGVENYGVYVASAAKITSTGTGANAGTITLDGTGGDGTDDNYGVYLTGTGTTVTSEDGAIDITGQGGDGSGDDSHGLFFDDAAVISSTGTGADAATITLDGTANGANGGFGLYHYGNANILSVDGAIDITGTGGANGGTGVRMDANSTILSTGTGANAATIDITGSSPSSDHAIFATDADNRISSVDGDITVTGNNSGSGNGLVLRRLEISSTGTGADAANITLNGTGAKAVYLLTSVDVTTVDGDISLVGTGSNSGIEIENNNIIASTNDGNITLTGTETGGTFNDIRVLTGTNIIGESGGDNMLGNITFNADMINLTDLAVKTDGTLTIKPLTSGTDMNIGSGTGALDLDDIALATLDAGTIVFGDAIKTGAININTTHAFDDNLVFISGNDGDITLDDDLTSSATGTAITLVSDRNYINNAGATGLTAANGRWLVYSADPRDDTVGGLFADFRRYGCTFAAGCAVGINVPGTSNGYAHSITPVLTATADTVTLTYGDAAPDLSDYDYTLSGYLAGDGAADTITGTLAGTTDYTQGSNAGGTYYINHNSGGLASVMGYDLTYADNSAAINVGKAALTATADDASREYGEANPLLSGVLTGFKLGEDETALATLPTYSTIATAASDVGGVAITGAGAAATNYDFTYVDGILSITKATLTVALDDNAPTRFFGASNPDFDLTYSGFKLGQDFSVIDSLPTASTTAISNSVIGDYDITLLGGSDNNYDLAYSSPAGILSVVAAPTPPSLPTRLPDDISITPSPLPDPTPPSSNLTPSPTPQNQPSLASLVLPDTVSKTSQMPRFFSAQPLFAAPLIETDRKPEELQTEEENKITQHKSAPVISLHPMLMKLFGFQ